MLEFSLATTIVEQVVSMKVPTEVPVCLRAYNLHFSCRELAKDIELKPSF
jgi:hypothetical protein